MTQEEVKKIIEKIKTKSLVINRVPKNTKAEFMQFAKEEFEEDYGMCLKHIWDYFKLWLRFSEDFDIKLRYIIELLEKKNVPSKEIKMLSGKKIKLKGGKNE